MIYRFAVVFAILLFCFLGTQAQLDTLPQFGINRVNEAVILSWTNNFKKPLASINIQRSYDRVKNFATIGTVLSPNNIENGYTDYTAPYHKMYYKLQLIFENGDYIITTPFRLQKDTTQTLNLSLSERVKRFSETFSVDSSKQNKIKNSTVESPFSANVYNTVTGNIIINLPDAATKNYKLIFYTTTGAKLFEIKKLPEDFLILDKINFPKSGTYTFELFEGDALVEKKTIIVSPVGKKQ